MPIMPIKADSLGSIAPPLDENLASAPPRKALPPQSGSARSILAGLMSNSMAKPREVGTPVACGLRPWSAPPLVACAVRACSPPT